MKEIYDIGGVVIDSKDVPNIASTETPANRNMIGSILY